MPPIEYKILETVDAQSLAVQVNQSIAAGWQPQGGVATAREGCDPCQTVSYLQAMIRKSP